MKFIIEFDSFNEDDKIDLELMLSAKDFACFLNDVHNKFRGITKYDALKLEENDDIKGQEAAEKVIDIFYKLLNEYEMSKFL